MKLLRNLYNNTLYSCFITIQNTSKNKKKLKQHKESDHPHNTSIKIKVLNNMLLNKEYYHPKTTTNSPVNERVLLKPKNNHINNPSHTDNHTNNDKQKQMIKSGINTNINNPIEVTPVREVHNPKQANQASQVNKPNQANQVNQANQANQVNITKYAHSLLIPSKSISLSKKKKIYFKRENGLTTDYYSFCETCKAYDKEKNLDFFKNLSEYNITSLNNTFTNFSNSLKPINNQHCISASNLRQVKVKSKAASISNKLTDSLNEKVNIAQKYDNYDNNLNKIESQEKFCMSPLTIKVENCINIMLCKILNTNVKGRKASDLKTDDYDFATNELNKPNYDNSHSSQMIKLNEEDIICENINFEYKRDEKQLHELPKPNNFTEINFSLNIDKKNDQNFSNYHNKNILTIEKIISLEEIGKINNKDKLGESNQIIQNESHKILNDNILAYENTKGITDENMITYEEPTNTNNSNDINTNETTIIAKQFMEDIYHNVQYKHDNYLYDTLSLKLVDNIFEDLLINKNTNKNNANDVNNAYQSYSKFLNLLNCFITNKKEYIEFTSKVIFLAHFKNYTNKTKNDYNNSNIKKILDYLLNQNSLLKAKFVSSILNKIEKKRLQSKFSYWKCKPNIILNMHNQNNIACKIIFRVLNNIVNNKNDQACFISNLKEIVLVKLLSDNKSSIEPLQKTQKFTNLKSDTFTHNYINHTLFSPRRQTVKYSDLLSLSVVSTSHVRKDTIFSIEVDNEEYLQDSQFESALLIQQHWRLYQSHKKLYLYSFKLKKLAKVLRIVLDQKLKKFIMRWIVYINNR